MSVNARFLIDVENKSSSSTIKIILPIAVILPNINATPTTCFLLFIGVKMANKKKIVIKKTAVATHADRASESSIDIVRPKSATTLRYLHVFSPVPASLSYPFSLHVAHSGHRAAVLHLRGTDPQEEPEAHGRAAIGVVQAGWHGVEGDRRADASLVRPIRSKVADIPD